MTKMTKKKKVGLIIGVIVLVIAGFIGKYQYDQYRAEENLKLVEMSNIFMTIYPEDDDLWKGAHGSYTNEELKAFQKNPPKIRMDTSSGLGLKVLAYNYYNESHIDAVKIQEMMESGQFHDTYEYTIGFVDWANKNEAAVSTYERALEYAANKLGISLPIDRNERTYKNYLNIINNPDGQKYIEEYYAR